MTPVPPISNVTTATIGKLCIGGDWACAHGDFGGLRDIAQRLAALADEPMHCRLVELASACRSDPERAAALWDDLKNLLYRASA